MLDKLLVDAAADSGVEVREGFTVDELLMKDGIVTGIRGHEGRQRIEETGRIVIGADGVNSFVARALRVPEVKRAWPSAITSSSAVCRL